MKYNEYEIHKNIHLKQKNHENIKQCLLIRPKYHL